MAAEVLPIVGRGFCFEDLRLGFALLGVLLVWLREEQFIERRVGYDRRSGSPVR